MLEHLKHGVKHVQHDYIALLQPATALCEVVSLEFFISVLSSPLDESENRYLTGFSLISLLVCIRIRTRGRIYGNIRLRPYFAVYPESSPNTDIISFLIVTLWPFLVLPSEVGLY